MSDPTLTDPSPPAAAPLPTPAPPPRTRPRLVDGNFWPGFGFGILACLFLVGGGCALFVAVMAHQMKSFAGAAGGLARPPLPPASAADYDWTVHALDGKAIPMSTFKGKVLFLNFWATWCGPCVAELEGIQALWEKTKGDRVAFLLVSREDAPRIQEFMRKKSLTVPVYHLEGKPPAMFETSAIPATFIVSPDGRIMFQHVGAAKWDDPVAISYLNDLR